MVLRTYLPSLWVGSIYIKLRKESLQKYPTQPTESECNKHCRQIFILSQIPFVHRQQIFKIKDTVILTEQEELLALQTNQCIGNC